MVGQALGNSQADIIIKVAMQMIQSSKDIAKQTKDAAKRAGVVNSSVWKQNYQKALNQQKSFNKKRFELQQLLPKGQFRQVQEEYTRIGNTVQGKLMTPLERINLANKKVVAGLKSAKGEFQGWAMSVMFFGMAMQR